MGGTRGGFRPGPWHMRNCAPGWDGRAFQLCFEILTRAISNMREFPVFRLALDCAACVRSFHGRPVAVTFLALDATVQTRSATLFLNEGYGAASSRRGEV